MNLVNRGWAQQVQQLTAKLVSSWLNSTSPFIEIAPVDNSNDRINVSIIPKGGGAFSLATPDGTTVGGNLRGADSIDLQLVRYSAARVASGSQSVAIGSGNVVSGTYACAIGELNSATGTNATALGDSCTASGTSATAIGWRAQANSTAGIAIGYDTLTRGVTGYHAYGASKNLYNNAGYCQSGLLLLSRATTNATSTRLTSDGNASAATNQVVLPNTSAYYFRGYVIAVQSGGGTAKGWTIEGVIRRGANAASTALVGTPTVTSSFADAGASTWTIAVSADTTNGAIAVDATGQASTNIRWNAEIRTTEIVYA